MSSPTKHKLDDDDNDGMQPNKKPCVNWAYAPEELKQLTAGDVAFYRARLLKEQGGICALCKLQCKKYVLDHKHKKRLSDTNGVNGDGCIRGVLCDGCNRIEASICSSFDSLVFIFIYVFLHAG